MFRRISYFAIFVLVVLVVVGLLLPDSFQRTLRKEALEIASPALELGSKVKSLFTAVDAGMQTLQQAQVEVQKLRTENDELRVQMQLAGDLKKRVDALQEQLNFKTESPYKVMACRVIGREPATWWSKVIVNRGHQDGLTQDLPVVTPRGVVGKLGIVSENTAEVILMIDINCKIAARIQETNEQGIVIGEGNLTGEGSQQAGKPHARIKYISRKANLDANQLVYTSSLGGVFPAGLPIGMVSEVPGGNQGNFGLYKEALVDPWVDFNKLDDLFIIIGAK